MTAGPLADGGAARVAANLARLRDHVAEACRTARRDPAEVTVIGVTKYVDAATARLVHAAGCHDLAESRPQSLWAKAEALADLVPPPRWHLVGHLQRNKVRRTLAVGGQSLPSTRPTGRTGEVFDERRSPHPAAAAAGHGPSAMGPLIHSLDSLRLLQALEAEAAATGDVCEALVEVNLASDPGRTGATEAEAENIIRVAAAMPHVRVLGLMGMASVPDGDPGAARREFARLRELRDRFAAALPAGDRLRELSMGMSGDFVEAILEGATLVRIGSALFAGPEP